MTSLWHHQKFKSGFEINRLIRPVGSSTVVLYPGRYIILNIEMKIKLVCKCPGYYFIIMIIDSPGQENDDWRLQITWNWDYHLAAAYHRLWTWYYMNHICYNKILLIKRMYNYLDEISWSRIESSKFLKV